MGSGRPISDTLIGDRNEVALIHGAIAVGLEGWPVPVVNPGDASPRTETETRCQSPIHHQDHEIRGGHSPEYVVSRASLRACGQIP